MRLCVHFQPKSEHREDGQEFNLFKHALVQDAAYGTLLREPRRVLHTRIAETLESTFTEITENQPELLARHFTEAGPIETAALLWGKAGQRSLARSALIEGVSQLGKALGQIATLPGSATLRREQTSLNCSPVTLLRPVRSRRPRSCGVKAGQRSLARSALIEGVSQLGKALGQIATLPGSATLRRQQIRLQVVLANALMHVKDYAAPDTVDVEA